METMDKKELEKRLSLHLNVLSRMSINRDVDVSVVEEGHGTYCDIGRGKIFIEEVSKDFDILLGLGFHELGHQLATSGINYTKEFGIPPGDVRGLHAQLNSLEDYRIENRIAVLYPPSEYYLKKIGRWFRLDYAQKQQIGQMTANPIYILHLLLNDIDLSKFIKKDVRKVVRQLREELRAKEFSKLPSTRALFPLALDAYLRLKPFFPPGQSSPGGEDGSLSARSKLKPKAHPIFEEIPDDRVLSDGSAGEGEEEDGDITSTQKVLRFQEKVEKAAEERKNTVAPLKRGRPPTVKENREYVRPHVPEVKKVSTYAEYDADGIHQEAYSAEQGRLIGLKLMQELRFTDGARHRLDDGELNVETVIESMQENKGVLQDMNVFSDETPLIHDHTVLILMDMSGSMEGNEITIARSAALMLARALEELNVPYSIRGFGAVSGKLEIHDYVIKDFDGVLSLAKLRSMFMGCVNRDSDSLRHAISLISAERGKKLIFLISDGRPNHDDGVPDYRTYNEQAYMDMYHVIREAEREGISIIGVGITSDSAEFIRGTYLKGFYIDNIEELPDKLVKIYLEESAGLRSWRSCLL